MAAKAGSPADGGVDDDPTPAEVRSSIAFLSRPLFRCFLISKLLHVPKPPQIDDVDEKKRIKDEEWIKDGEKCILGWNAEEAQVMS